MARVSFGIALALLASTSVYAEEIAPLTIFVSKDSQSLVVYDGDQIITTSNVSTGKPGHTTPSGIFSILEKRKTHFSNLYDSSPMPWMQRLTWSGVALHESRHVPDYPASHGCVRMPAKFAAQLFPMTKRGFHVVISDREIVPRRVASEAIFSPRYRLNEQELLNEAALRPAFNGTEPVEIAMAESLPKAGAVAVAAMPEQLSPIKILITRATAKQKLRDVEAVLDKLGYTPGTVDGTIDKQTRKAVRDFQNVHGFKPTGEIDSQTTALLYQRVNRKPVTGWLFARQNFKPAFDAPVDIDKPELGLGTHFFTASRSNPAQHQIEWYASTLENHLNAKKAARLGITAQPDFDAPDAAEQAFARVTIPTDIRNRIETALGSGSSITVTDTGTESETGKGTDFITVTTKVPANVDGD